MSRMSIATPCPAPYASSNLPIPIPHRRLSTASTWSAQDDTAELEYTRAIQVEFKNAKPRRKSTFNKREKQQQAVTIFEDVLEDEELVVPVPVRAEIGGSTLLGKPAQRLRGHAVVKKEEPIIENQPLPLGSQTGRRASFAPKFGIAQHEHEADVTSHGNALTTSPGRDVKGDLKKEPRRRTIFVPADDTTMSTINPVPQPTERVKNRLPSDLTSRINVINQEFEAYQPAKKQRMSLAAAPKRVPLQQVAAKDNIAGLDIAGQNGGKENHPPHASSRIDFKKPSQDCHSHTARQSISGSSLFEPTAASRARQTAVVRNAVPLPGALNQSNAQSRSSPRQAKPPPNARARVSLLPSPPRPEQVTQARHVRATSQNEDSKRTSPRQQISPKHERKTEARTARLQRYPVLSENLANPELYEDNWLSHQEVALTELVNQIFDSASLQQHPKSDPGVSLREQLVQIYHQPRVKTLHKRLKASLLYGALSRPRDSSNPPNPAQDIGLRKRFLGFWLHSYDTKSLRAAAEVVFGRQLPKEGHIGSNMNESSLDPHRNRRALVGFLETFLVEVDDAEDPDEDRGDDPNMRWQKMVLRSLMLVWLLDQAKTSQAISGCLFKTASLQKSSVAVLHALVGMLIPSVGEITRVLRHLDYEVFNIQDPLDEVKYLISNIAVDLRDGIILTRLVEILLFSPNRIRAMDTNGDATITVYMPDLTILESAIYHEQSNASSRILSQHLKMPCLGRAQKTYNVQIALSALHDHGRLDDRTSNITADDIVDGHREKTLCLLWALVSTHGLQQLVDFRELAADMKRMTGTAADMPTWPADEDAVSQQLQESLLKKWAAVYASQQGMRISNLTTSFADGKVYAAILHGFSDYLHVESKSQSDISLNSSTLQAQLQSLGCSNAFIKQLWSANGTIPSRKTTISNLAFLASRLLPLARQANAARVIQRAYRIRRSRLIVSRRVGLMRLAYACATVVQTQDRMIDAAMVLQRSWRKVLDARITRLNGDVTSFQALARRWLVGRRVQRSLIGDQTTSHSLRIMGGW